jgi:hypothetical protein
MLGEGDMQYGWRRRRLFWPRRLNPPCPCSTSRKRAGEVPGLHPAVHAIVVSSVLGADRHRFQINP